METVNWLLEPFRYPFMQKATLAGVLVAVTCASLGVYVVLRRMAFIGDALSHTILPGLVVAYLNRWNLTVGAAIAAVATALGIGWLSSRREIREDTAIGILFTGMFALGILLISTVRSYRDFTQMLFGYILGVTGDQLVLIAVIALIVIASLVLFHKELELTSVDPTYAGVIGLSASLMRYTLLGLMALAVVAAIQVVGVVLTSALLVVPGAAASLLTNRLSRMMALSVGVAIISTFVGLFASFRFDVSSGASIVLTSIVLFLMAWLFRTLRENVRARTQSEQSALAKS